MRETGFALIIIPWIGAVFGEVNTKLIIWNEIIGAILVICSYLIK